MRQRRSERPGWSEGLQGAIDTDRVTASEPIQTSLLQGRGSRSEVLSLILEQKMNAYFSAVPRENRRDT